MPEQSIKGSYVNDEICDANIKRVTFLFSQVKTLKMTEFKCMKNWEKKTI